MKSINGKTSLIGLLGQPVSHSLSPVIHNAALGELDLDWSYMAFPCDEKDLEIALKGLRALGCRGLNITIPHKQKVVRFCTGLSQLAERLNAVNTLIPNEKGGWIGANTDVEGFIKPLKDCKQEWSNLKAIVIGSGGSARAVVAGLQELNLEQIIVIGRKKEKLNNFLKDLKKDSVITNSSSRKKILRGLLDNDVFKKSLS